MRYRAEQLEGDTAFGDGASARGLHHAGAAPGEEHCAAPCEQAPHLLGEGQLGAAGTCAGADDSYDRAAVPQLGAEPASLVVPGSPHRFMDEVRCRTMVVGAVERFVAGLAR